MIYILSMIIWFAQYACREADGTCNIYIIFELYKATILSMKSQGGGGGDFPGIKVSFLFCFSSLYHSVGV